MILYIYLYIYIYIFSLYETNETFYYINSFPGGSVVKNLLAKSRDAGSIPGSGRFLGGGSSSLLQCSCLEKSHGQKNLVGFNP